MIKKAILIPLLVIGGIFLFLFGMFFGYISPYLTPKTNPDVSSMMMSTINEQNIRIHLRHLTEDLVWKTPTTETEHKAAEYILNYWKSIGLSNVKATPYDILVNYPDKEHLNSFKIINETSSAVIFEANTFEDLPHSGNAKSNDDDVHLKSLFLSNSYPGLKKGKIIYVNYARIEDFDYLVLDSQQNISEYICLARYGKIARGIKTVIAERFGCLALVLYSDPIDYNANINEPPYPLSWQMPDTSIQRGTIKIPYKGLGDILTPNYPATKEAFRNYNFDSGLPKIPVHVLRSDDVKKIFNSLNSSKIAPQSWQGGMSIEYGIGGYFTDDDVLGEVSVSMKSTMGTSYNVFGFIEGEVEKDRYVMVGNHYDSWGPGAVDPTIGISTLMELSRTFMEIYNSTMWRPRRSILFCAWGAEEIGSIGSREFVEEFDKIISLRTVAYLNVDVATLGNYSIKVKSQPQLKDAILRALKQVTNPDELELSEGRNSLYETYALRFPENEDPSKPSIKFMNTGSDYVHFIGFAGVPSLDLRYTYNESTGIDFYPLYHTANDDFYYFETFVDPSYKFTKAVAQLWGELMLKFSDEKLIPYSISAHVDNIKQCVQTFVKKLDGNTTSRWLTILTRYTNDLALESRNFESSLQLIDQNNIMALRQANDKLMLLEKAFLYQDQLKGREGVRNSLYAPSIGGGQICFSRINDLLDGLDYTSEDIDTDVNEELSKIVHFLRTAVSMLKGPSSFLTGMNL